MTNQHTAVPEVGQAVRVRSRLATVRAEAPATFGHNKWVPVHKALRYMVLREFTTGVRRTDCLESMGLAQVVYSGLVPENRRIRDLAATLDCSPDTVVQGISLILDNWRRNRILYVTGDPVFSRFHAKDDPYIQAGLLPLREFRPEGLLEQADQTNPYARGLIAQPIDAMPLTDLDLAHESRITEDEHLRFSMPVSVLGRLRKRNRGGKAFKIGNQEVSYLRGQGIELVNLGEASRVKQGELGHWICSVCGAAKTPYAVPTELANFQKIHKERCGRDVTQLALSVQAEVDLLQFHSVDSEAAGINIGEALRAGTTRLLDTWLYDLELLIVQKPDDKQDLLLYDPMPGGSGILEQMLTRWPELISTAESLLANCPQACETACYVCLKTFRNQYHHDLLNRHSALELIEALNHEPYGYRDILPVFEEERPEDGSPSNTPEARLLRILNDHHFPAGVCRKRITTSLGIATELSMKQVYGVVGEGIIHVHHVKPLSKIRKGYHVDPVVDLRPVCPNCHAVLHSEDPAITVAKLRGLLAKQRRSRS